MYIFIDRMDAGRQLAAKLSNYTENDNTIILALPRGGVTVAYEVAKALHLPLELFIIRKLRVPTHEELAMGVLAADGSTILNKQLIEKFNIDAQAIASVINKEKIELKRRNAVYRKNRDWPTLTDKTIILIDDGLATGSTILASILAIRTQNPAKIIVAIPVGNAASCLELHKVAEEIICLAKPSPFYAVGQAYLNFPQVTDQEVQDLLEQAKLQGLHPVNGHKITTLKDYMQPLQFTPTDYDSILLLANDAEHIFIGEATHGTEEFYQIRIDITKRLILEKDFTAIAIEGDWPDTYLINRYVHGDPSIKDAASALTGFKKFPSWLWRNHVMIEFIEWLRLHNDSISPDKDKVSFYGLDLYGLHASIEAVINYLEKKDPLAAARAKSRYACFDHFKDKLQNYGYTTIFGTSKSCEDAVLEQLLELKHSQHNYLKENDKSEDEFFYIEQNALLIKNAEKYYRMIFGNNSASCNLRDSHMAETLDKISQYLTGKLHQPAKIITWAHNSHIGDARGHL